MAVEKITLNLIPTGETPTIHAAQFDKEREFQIELKEGEEDFSPTGYDIEIQVRKVDNNIVTAVPSQVSGNIVTFLTTEQMTACSGTNLAELQISKDNKSIATLHFYLVVQRDVLAGGVTSASAIHNLTEQIADIVPEVIGDDYYNKTEVDELIAEHTFDPTNYYDKSETDALLNDKADVSDLPDMTNYYTKHEVDSALSGKANSNNVYSKSQTYNRTEIDNALALKVDKSELYNVYPTEQESGAIVHITDGADNIPVKSLVSQIVAVESGSGTKSPETPYTISGFDSGVVNVCGVNLWDEEWELGIWGSDGRKTADNNAIRSKNYIAVVPNSSIYLVLPFQIVMRELDINKNVIKTVTPASNQTYILLPNTKYIVFCTFSHAGITSYSGGLSFNYPSSDKQYHAGNGNTYTFAFGQTVYGGYFNNKGNLVVTHSFIASYNGETINEPWISSKDNYVPNTSPSIGAEVVYPLTTPTTLSITSQDIPTLLGENNIYSNCGDIKVDYHADIGLYIDKKISSLAQN